MFRFFKKHTPSSLYCQTRLQQLPVIPVKASAYEVLERPERFHARLLTLIREAKERIMLTVLYLQDDEAGREILNALYEAKAKNPLLHIMVYVDYHRAQRGLIGQDKSAGNAGLYYSMAEARQPAPAIYGKKKKKREIFGVMHLKGCVFDNTVLYSGASVNNVYLGVGGRYRLDRYHEIHSRELADTFCRYVNDAFHINLAVQDFSQGQVRPIRDIRDAQKTLRRHLTLQQYTFRGARLKSDEVGITPVVGLGKRGNPLNRDILWMITGAAEELFICTPYFNPPKVLLGALNDTLARGVHVTLVVGDKVANDFYIPETEKFSAVGAVPYIYEMNLREFVAAHEKEIAEGILNVMLWSDGTNTYHLKGLFVDRNLALVTGNNLNPRAWSLDLENGLIVHDPHHLLQEKFMHEKQHILRHTRRIEKATDLESLEDYPEPVRKILERVRRFRASLVIKQLL